MERVVVNMETEGQNGKQDEKEDEKAREYDSAWKEVIEEHFESFLEFFFPEIHKDIEFSKGFEFLSKELRNISPDGNVGKRFADELIKVHLKNGGVKYICIFIHIEVQGTRVVNFVQRVYIYNYRIFNQHLDKGVEVVSLVILTDEDKNYRPDQYHVGRWGFDLRMRFPLVKLIDYRDNEELAKKLEESTSPMAMVVKAQLNSYDAKKHDNNKKYDVKRDLIRQCYRRGYEKEQIQTLLKFMNWIIRLPKEFEMRLSDEIARIEEVEKMPYVTTWERIAKEEGQEIGVKKEKKATAIKLIKKGMKNDFIADVTGFPIKKIEELAAEAQ